MANISNATALAVSKKHIICSEILSVTSAMRKNSRWASISQTPLYPRQDAFAASLGLRRVGESPESHNHSLRREVLLMAAFLDLKREVQSAENINELSNMTLFSPFFSIIRSPLSTGPITSAALNAMYKFFVSGFVRLDAADLEIMLAELSYTVSHCKFEASDAAGDEIALYRIMAVIEQCMCGPVGERLGDTEVCEMLETVLTTCCQMRLSEILRRYAESTMRAIVRKMFRRLGTLNPVEEEAKLVTNSTDSSEELKMNVQTQGTSTPILSGAVDIVPATPTLPALDQEKTSDAHSRADTPVKKEEISPSATTPTIRSDYGLPSILELLRVLVNILDPNDRLHTDSTRLTALRILDTAFEVAGTFIGNYSSLVAIIQDHGCKYLFQLARSDNPNVLYMSLRVISAMFETMRRHLKLQQELFLTFAIDRLAPSEMMRSQIASMQQKGLLASPRPGTPITTSQAASTSSLTLSEAENAAGPSRRAVAPAKGEMRELMLEALNLIARHPSFMVDLFVNYDCDINCEDLFEKLVDFFTKGVYSVAGPGSREPSQQASQVLSLDILLDFVKYMADRANGKTELWPQEYPPPGDLLHDKSQKRLVLTGAARFNVKPKVGLSFLEEHKLIYSDLSDTIDRPKSLAMFLKSCSRIDKRVLGDFLSKPDNLDVLKAFVALFNFKEKSIAEAMRELLESFRLPGEAQQIDRITETFAAAYFSSKPAEIKSQDATHVLAFSIMLLNTDLHNPQIRKRMTLDDYKRNVRGVNDGSDFSPEFLSDVYESIRKREIVMPEEHTGQVGFGYAWKELLARARSAGPFNSCNTSLFDATMFRFIWRPVIASIAHAFTTFDDDYTVQRAITGFRQLATLASHFDLPEVFDYVVVSLSQQTSLVPETLMTRVPHYPVVEVEGQDVTVSSLSVKFGTNFKGQLAAVVLFTIINGNGNAVREGWTQIFEIYLNLFLHSLLPNAMLQTEDFLGGQTAIPLHSFQPPPRTQGRADGGLLSALSSYLLTPYNSNTEAVPEATDSEVENTLCTIDCIAACKLEELYSQISLLESAALVAAIRALEALVHERTVARLKQEIDDPAIPSSPHPRKPTSQTNTLSYDPGSVYLLETMVSLVSKTPQYIDDTWPVVFEHLSALLSSASSYSVLLIERAVAGLWRLCMLLAQKPALRDQLYISLDLLASLPPSVIDATGEQIVAGVTSLVKSHRNIIKSQTEWGIVVALIRSTMRQPAAARQSFELVVSLLSEGETQCVTADNFTGLISLLDDYATLAGLAVESGGQHDKRRAADSPHEAAIQRGKQAVELLFDLKRHIPQFLESGTVPADQLWKQCYLPLVSSLAKQSTNASREVRHNALIHLQRMLLSQQAVLEEEQVEAIFNRVVFPLVDDLLEPQVLQLDPRGMPETRLRASALLCKVFMQYEVNDAAKQKDVRVLWVQVLDLLDRLMNADKRDQLYEAVPESLKNVVLVMNAMDILVPSPTPDTRDQYAKDLWNATHERIERFLPGFLDEIIPSPPPPPPPVVPSTSAEPEAKTDETNGQS